MTARRCFVWLLLAILTIALPAIADIRGAPIKVRFVAEPPAVRPFEPCTGTLELVAARDLAIEGMTLAGRGLTRARADKAAPALLAAGDRFKVPFSLVPTEAEPILEITLRSDGRDLVLPVDLAAARRAWEDGARIPVADETGAAGRRWPTKPRPRPEDGLDPGWQDDGPGNGTGLDKSVDVETPARTITVYGSLKYFRADGVLERPAGIPFAIWDEDLTYDDKLASGVTDQNGHFSVTFTWDPCSVCEDDPDIYVEFVTADGDIDVQTSWLEWTYAFPSYVVDDFKGTELSFLGLIVHEKQQLLHIFMNLRRAFDRYAIAGYDLDSIDLQYDAVSSYYDPYWEEIHLDSSYRWQESTYWHELGHHWSKQFADFFNPLVDYCNYICDVGPSAPFCTHCLWCPETRAVAELEGTAHFQSWLMGDIISGLYDPPPAHPRYIEEIGECFDGMANLPCPCIYDETEGFLAAFLIDLADDQNEDDPKTEGYADVLSLNAWNILLIDDELHCNDVYDWWDHLKLYFPDIVPQMWETARNNFLDFDTQPPSNVAGLRSPSHEVGVSSPDATVTLLWDPASDDASGVAGYAVSLSLNRAGTTSTTVSVETAKYTTPILAPGNWYFNVRAVDNKGQASTRTTSLGPFVVRTPYPSDLYLSDSQDWPLEVVATTRVDESSEGPPLPSKLNGWGTTYWHYRGINDGESAIPEAMTNNLLVDGQPLDSNELKGAGANLAFSFKNQGPVTVPGGRHCFSVQLDGSEVVPETIENNNITGFQWVWSPVMLELGTAYNRAAPGCATGGLAEASAYVFNADGYRFTGTNSWNAVYAYTWSDTSNYDLRLHQPSTGSTHGFKTVLEWSARPPGLLDAVLVNGNQTPLQYWDVGVLNGWEGGSGFTIRHVGAIGQPNGGTLAVTMPHGQHLLLLQFPLADAVDGALSLIVDGGPGAPPLHLGWLDANFTTGTLLDARKTTTSGPDGIARLDIDAERTGMHAMVVWREPEYGAGNLPLNVSVIQTPADLVPFAASNWCAPLVPRSFYASTPYVVSLPDTLLGNTFTPDGTYFCLCANNLGPEDAAAVPSRILLDGEEFETYEWYALLSGIAEKRFFNQAYRVRGGRHTLSLVLDDPDSITEIDESNNIYGAQWVWGPLPLTYTGNSYRPAPPDPIGGLDTVDGQLQVMGLNCDGLRLPAADPAQQPGTWQAVAVMPGDTSNVEVLLYEAVGGTTDGFLQAEAASYWGPGQLDYILIDNGRTDRRPFDVGVRLDSGEQGYHARAVNSVDLGAAPTGAFGPFTLGQVQYLHLYECELPAGPLKVTLRSVGGTVDWGLALYRSGGPSGKEDYLNRTRAVTFAHNWLAGPGEDESFDITVPAADRYCVAVFKKGAADVQASGDYILEFGEGLSDVPPVGDGLPARIVAVQPNPFNPRTTVVFDVDSAGEAAVDIYDVRGRLVRTLTVPTTAAGRYRAEWDGCDAGGRAAASGSYFLRLRCGGRVLDLAKGVLVR